MIPPWLPDAIGSLSALLLAIPAWRATSMLKAISRIQREVPVAPQPEPGNTSKAPRFIPHEDAASAIADGMTAAANRWNRLDEVMLKAGLVLLALSFLLRLLGPMCT